MREGDRVFYISGRLGDDEKAPIYNGRYGKVVGKLLHINHLNSHAYVRFINKINLFRLSDLVPKGCYALTIPEYRAIMQIALCECPQQPSRYPTLGDNVVYVSGRYGSSGVNPLCVSHPLHKRIPTQSIGILTHVCDPREHYRCKVEWPNGKANTYLMDDLRTIYDPMIGVIWKKVWEWKQSISKKTDHTGAAAPKLVLDENRIKGVFNV